MQSLGPYFGRVPREVINIIVSKLSLKDSFAIRFISRYFRDMDRSLEVRLRCENLSVADYTFLREKWASKLSSSLMERAHSPFFPLILKVYCTSNLVLWQTPNSRRLNATGLITDFKSFISSYTNLTANHIRGVSPLISEAQEIAKAWQARLKLPNDEWIYAPTCCGEIFRRAWIETRNPLHCTYLGITELLEGQQPAGIEKLQENASRCTIAQYVLGTAYKVGCGVEKDEKQAVEWLKLAAEKNDPHAQLLLGEMYENGQGVEKNPLKAALIYLCMALENNREAKSHLGTAYDNGVGVDKDKKLAAHLYRLAANQNEMYAQYNLGCLYLNGEGVEKNHWEALQLFWFSAVQGLSLSQTHLGYMYEKGLGTEKNEKEAVRWYRLAAEQDEILGQERLAVMYFEGRGVEKDDKEALVRFERAVAKKSARAQYYLGIMYEFGRGVQKDEAKAVRYYKLAVEQKDVQALNTLGLMYYMGRGVEKDDRMAAELFKEAALKEHVTAQSNLAYMYAHGHGVEKNIPEAISWYRRAAKQGCVLSHLCLGILLPSGEEASRFFEEGRKNLNDEILAMLNAHPSDDLTKQILAKLR